MIKRQDIYIPYCEIGITCLTKEVTEINLFFETVLKLVNIGVCDVYELSTIMGVEFRLLKETIVDMIEQRYIVTSENKLTMTQKGKKALKERQLVTIQKKNINQITVNMLTGDIEGNEKVLFGYIPKDSICLSEEQAVTKDFLESRYSVINDIYQKNQIETNVFNTKYVQRELYKILEITYDKLCYVKEELLIYKNNDLSDYKFLITGDIGEKYLNSFYHQVRDVVYSGMENFFERDWKFAQNHYNDSIVSLEERQKKQKLLKDLYGSEYISDELLDEFMQRRELIDNTELDMLFSYNTEIDFEGIIISCNRMRKLMNSGIISSLNQVVKKKIWLLYNKDEYNIKKFLNEKFDVKKTEMGFLEREGSEGEFICFYPNVLLEFKEKTEKVFERPLIILDGHIEFDSNLIKTKMSKIIKDNEISFLIPNSQMKKSKKNFNKEYKKVK